MSVISNIPLSEIETPLQPLLEGIAEAVLLIAPEREQDLKDLGEKLNWEYLVDGNKGGFGFAARQGTKNIVFMPLAALERLWAFIFGHLALFDIARTAKKPGVVFISDTPEARVAQKLLVWAHVGGKDRQPWPDGCPSPREPMEWIEQMALARQSFLGAVGFIVLHELAHLEHGDPDPEFQSDDESQKCEFRADEWAARWIMEKIGQRKDSPDCPDTIKRLWIYRASCIIHALCVINAVEFRAGGGRKTHPEPVERILNCAGKFFPESGEHFSPITDFPIYLASTILATQHVNLVSENGADIVYEDITTSLLDLFRRFVTAKSGANDCE